MDDSYKLINKKSKNIVKALHSAETDQDLYDALIFVSTDKIRKMFDMIGYILLERAQEEKEFDNEE